MPRGPFIPQEPRTSSIAGATATNETEAGMKVVLFCGGLGTRLRDYSDQIPKPLVDVGPRPILWHLMSYYAPLRPQRLHPLPRPRGARDQGVLPPLRRVPLERLRALRAGARRSSCCATTSTTGASPSSTPGSTPRSESACAASARTSRATTIFLANYADGLSDLDLDRYVDDFLSRDKIACFLSVPAPHTFHIVHSGPTTTSSRASRR